ncbi:transcription elongation factor GreA [Sulfurospirillum halorespirans]|uniref:Transcription elongation factor GreA n=1 Tax=Sulfurospirillum halorespirans DSM 13726 TaxID=1193502 RepID=A0A1D7TGH8_9BACT|nr:transcription elongation factor GreA [Sulfurospirillum halorespirans]AOO64040.1 transcription elongation factor GreA [Sulfurospirillum halorespirans DSM 13726]
MSNAKEPMTEYGYKKLMNELNDLKKKQRPETVIELDIARSHGDLKENAEYHAAKERLAFIDGRIGELSDLVSRAQVIDPTTYEHEKIRFGSTIMLENLETNEEVTYTIVGSTESNPDRGLISYYSPLAIQLMGRGEGEEVTIKLPSGKQVYEVLEVAYREINFEG